MKKACVLLLSLGLFMVRPGGGARVEKGYRQIPEILQIAAETRTVSAQNRTWIDSVITKSPEVNARLNEALARMRGEAGPELDSEDKQLEITANYRISGDSWASFLLVKRISTARRTQALSFECLSFDMATGKELSLDDLFPPDSGAWALLSDALRESLLSVYPGEDRQTAAIDALCQADAIREMPFLVGTYQLMLPIALGEVIPDKHQIVQTTVFFDELDTYFTQEAARQLDNTGYRVTALTFDDGPAGASTRQVIDALGHAGANATFFIIGSSLSKFTEGARRAADNGNLLGSHTMRHLYPNMINREYALRDREEFTALLQRLTGVTPRVFRAPGGRYTSYLKWKIGWPNFHWSFSAVDSSNNDPEDITRNVIGKAKDLSIVLMHDRSAQTARALPKILAHLRARHFLFATVEELLRMNGIPMEPDKSYRDGSAVTKTR